MITSRVRDSIHSNALVDRYPIIDILKALAAQLIVLHHYCVYGPISDAIHTHWPVISDLLFYYGRMAVQIFLVVAGYLAARTLAGRSITWRSSLYLIYKRYTRLAIPYFIAIATAVLCTALVNPWLSSDLRAALPSWQQLLSHIAMMQSLFNIDSISAGIWYVAIDLQLFILLTLIVWLNTHNTYRAQITIAVLCIASLMVFNRHPELDDWAIYFFGAYGLGVLAWWARLKSNAETPINSTLHARILFSITLLFGIIALIIQFRLRIALAISTSLMLALWGERSSLVEAHPKIKIIFRTLSLQSYVLFLIHFPILILINAIFTGLGFLPNTSSATTATTFLVAGWTVSLWTANIFYDWADSPRAAWRTAIHLH